MTDQNRVILEARRGALVYELAAIERALDEAEDQGRQEEAQRTAESEAEWLKAARRELDALIADEWGPQMRFEA